MDFWDYVIKVNKERYYLIPEGSATINPNELWKCPYRIGLSKRRRYPPKDDNFPYLRFAVGKWIEEGIVDLVKRAGLFVAGEELTHRGIWDLQFSGVSELIIRDLDNELAVVEIKTVDYFLRQKVPYDSHILQLKAYCYLFNIKRGYLLYIVKGGFDVQEDPIRFRFDFKEAELAEIQEKIKLIRSQLYIKPSQASEQCIKCEYRSLACLHLESQIKLIEEERKLRKRKRRDKFDS